MKKYVHYKGKKIFYSDEGYGIPVILVHGYLETAEVWESFSRKLAEKYRVISVDLPGHGNSDMYEATHTMEFLARSVNALLETIGIHKVFFVGHSLGGYVSLAYIELFPEKLTGYCLFHSHPFADTIEIIQKREREIHLANSGKKFLLYPENVKRMYADKNLGKFSASLERSEKIASGISAEGIVAVLKGMIARPSRLELMEKGVVPCLWILGTMDNYIPWEEVSSKVKLPANARLVVLRNSGHLGFVEEEDTVVNEITRFIKETSGTLM